MFSKKVLTVLSAALASVALAGAHAQADTAATIEGDASGTLVTYDGTAGKYPVITAILSQPGTIGTKTYSTYAILANDGTGSIELYGSLPTGSTYTPTVGDSISVSGKYGPYDSIPEIGSMTAITKETSGNPLPAVQTSTIPTLNVATPPNNVGGYLFNLNNVTISGLTGTTFGLTSEAGTITDASGNTMAMYYWPTSYSAAAANLNGTAIPTGPVDITGFDSAYKGTAQFVPVSIAAVPEPASLAVMALGWFGVADAGPQA